MSRDRSESPFQGPPSFEAIDASDPAQFLASMAPTRQGFLLESGFDVRGTGRWHICGVDPIGSFEATDDLWHGQQLGFPAQEGRGDPLDALDSWWRSWAVADATPSHPGPFRGGAIGWIGYEAADRFHGLPRRPLPDGPVSSFLDGIPDLCWKLYDEVVVIDALEGRAWFLHHNRDGWQQRRWWLDPEPAPPISDAPSVAGSRIIEASLADGDYLDAVSHIRASIGRGDVYEVNLALGMILDGVPSARDLHAIWRQVQPVPYAAMIQGDPFSLVSASPEQFLTRRADQIGTRPIKGTVPRCGDPAQDQMAAQRLLEDPKERAELAMIVDLERNDLGRICVPGSVEVVAAAEVEEYASVMHTVATVKGTLRGNPGPGEILRATFPGGSITGAPKLAAMEQIRQLEPWPRSVYTGSIGWIAPSGDMELNIAIRTALIRGERALVPFGGAVTWDSDPDAERDELAHKARTMLAALGIDAVEMGAPRDLAD